MRDIDKKCMTTKMEDLERLSWQAAETITLWNLRGSRMAGNSVVAGSGDNGPGDVLLWKLHKHTAAVKTLAWDSHVSGVLRRVEGLKINIFDFGMLISGSILDELDTGSQVTFFSSLSPFSSLNLTRSTRIWSLTSRELLSTHGFFSTTSQNQICIWKYPLDDPYIFIDYPSLTTANIMFWPSLICVNGDNYRFFRGLC